ncbi:hypothetical protein BG006_004364, partial [Podila minutissima]
MADIDPKTTFRIQHTTLSDSNLGPDELLIKGPLILLDLVLGAGLHSRGQIAVCGVISTYTDADAQGPEGFIVFDYAKQYGKAIEDMLNWIREQAQESRDC